MPQRYPFRYVNEAAGFFVLAVVLVLVVAAVAAGRAKRWFQPTSTLSLRMPAEGSLGLKKGADVFILGTVAGKVEDVAPGDDDRMEAELSVRQDFFERYVRDDSKIVVRKQFGVAGDAFIEIGPGSKALPALPRTGAVLAVADDVPADLITATIEDARKEVLPALKQFRAAAERLTLVAERADHIAAKVESGEGLAGKLLTDPKMADQVVQMLEDLNASSDDLEVIVKDVRRTTASMAEMSESANEQMKELPGLVADTRAALQEVQVVLRDIQKTTAKLPDTVEATDRTLQSLPGLVMQTEETLRQIHRLVEGAQRTWLLRGTMEADAAGGGRIRPEDVE